MKTCVILGNGPSANEFSEGWHALDCPPIFGMNYCPVQPTYYVCVDSDVLLNHVDEIYPLAAGATIAYLSSKHEGSSRLYELPYVRLVGKDFGPFFKEAFMSGFTAAYVALKQAYYLGFEVVHLWGVDHSPGWEHYRPDYPPPARDIGARMKMMEMHYGIAAQVYARAGRRIINHSNPSRLDMIFERAKVTA